MDICQDIRNHADDSVTKEANPASVGDIVAVDGNGGEQITPVGGDGAIAGSGALYLCRIFSSYVPAAEAFPLSRKFKP